MKIVYNPADGAPIKDFIYRGEKKQTFFPDGFRFEDGKFANGLMQFEDAEANELLETFEFLKALSSEEAQKIIDRPADAKYKCDFPGCEFATTHPIALAGHKRAHAKSVGDSSQPIVDESLIPVARGSRVLPLASGNQEADNIRKDIPNGTDSDGVDWYGEGVQVENKGSFNGMRPIGKGHFGG